MNDATTVLLVLTVGVYALKATGPLLLGGRELPPLLTRVVALLPAALLAALVATSAVTSGRTLVLDARVVALAVAALALRLRAPFVVVVLLAAATAAGVRALS